MVQRSALSLRERVRVRGNRRFLGTVGPDGEELNGKSASNKIF
jgi:hypothetical protein